MALYDYIKQEINQSLFYCEDNTRILRIEKLFIYEKLQLIVGLIYDTPAIGTKGNTDFYYGIYDAATKKALKQYSNEYQKIVESFPPAQLLTYENFSFNDIRTMYNIDNKTIQEYINTFYVNNEYWDSLNNVANHLHNQNELNLIEFFLCGHRKKTLQTPIVELNKKDIEEKKEEEQIETKDNKTEYVFSTLATSTINTQEIVFNNLISNENKNKNINQDLIKEKDNVTQKEESHTKEILIMTIVAMILGFISSTIVAGPWH